MNAKLYIVTLVILVILRDTKTIDTEKDRDSKSCHSFVIGDQFYKTHAIWEKGRPYNLNMHRPTNTLFFSFTPTETDFDSDFQLALLNVNDYDNQIIPDVPGGFAIAIDKEKGDIYLGGNDGIYKYNFHYNVAVPYKEKGKNIWGLFYHKRLFYISYPNQRLHMEVDGEFLTVKEFANVKIDHFYISSYKDIYIANKTGFYKYSDMGRKVEIVSKLLAVRHMVEDVHNNLYICTDVGVFVDKGEGFKKLIETKNLNGLVFDNNNEMIISDDRSIMRAEETYHSVC